MSSLRHLLVRPVCLLHRRKFTSHAVRIVDLRSDTLTHPTAKMREAMKTAKVGDDVYGEDPTVNKLEEMSADVLGKEAALLVPTCTMANTISVLVHCNGRFNEVLLGASSHMHLYEVAGMAQFAGVQGRCIPNLRDGTLGLEALKEMIRPVDDDHQPWTKLICLENTHNKCGGKVISLEYTKKVRELANDNDLKLHLDGARVFNAAASLKVPVSTIAKDFDTVSTAFSKGLCCPVGSIISGTKDFIAMARRARKAMGGGMRQAGVIAAPMIVALEEMTARLVEDHQRAASIAQAIGDLKENAVCRVEMDGVQSNIVMIDMLGTLSAERFCERMKAVPEDEVASLGESVSVLMLPFTSTTVRYVTHNDITDQDVEKVAKKLKYVIETFPTS